MSAPGSPQRQRGEQEDVLAEVLLNQSSTQQGGRAEEAEDLKLARLLQEQERAWMAAAAVGSPENLAPQQLGSPGRGGGVRRAALTNAAGSGEGAANVRQEQQQQAEGSVALTDEEVAQQLQEEEEREFQTRLLAMAGAAPGEEGEEGYLPEDEVDPDEMTYEELTALGEAVGTVSRGVSAAAVEALPIKQYHEVAGSTAAGEEQCPVCRVEFEPEDAVRLLPCGHYYHPDCIGGWLQRNKVCCICSKEVATGEHAGRAHT